MGASQITGTLSIADATEGEVVVTFKKLNWKKLKEAARAQSEEYYASIRNAPKAVVEGWQAKSTPASDAPLTEANKAKALNAKRKARYAAYDRDTLFQASVTSVSVEGVKMRPWLDDLADDDAQRLHEAILDLSLPPIDPDVEEADRKND